MAGKHVRGVDPANSVTRALDARRGFTSQADVRETKHAVERLGVVGDNPNEIGGNLSVSGDLTGGGDLLLQWPIGGDDKDVKIVGVEAGAETTYLHAHYEPDLFIMTWYNLWNNSGLFALHSSPAFNDAELIVYAPAMVKFWNAAAAETMTIDPETGDITTTGEITANGVALNGSNDRWQSGAHADLGAATLSAVGMPAWTVPATASSNPGTTGSYVNFATGAVSGNVSGPNGPFITRLDWDFDVTFHISVVDTTNVRLHIGLYASDPSGITNYIGNMAGFRYDTATDGTTWRCRTADGATGASTDSGVTVAVGEVTVRMVGTLTEVAFYIDGVLVVTRTTNLPTSTASLAPYARVTTLTALAKNLRFGYFNALSQ